LKKIKTPVLKKTQVTFIEAMDTFMPTFDPEIRRVPDLYEP